MDKAKAQEAKDRYLKESVETFVVRVPKGDKKRLQEAAKAQKKSLNAFIVEAVNEKIEREKQKT